MKSTRLLLAAAVGLLAVASSLRGFDYQISRRVIHSTGTVGDGSYSLCATAGQPEAAAASLTGGGFTLRGGFWYAAIPHCDLPGDVNGDLRIDGLDVQTFANVLLGFDSVPDHFCAADMTQDGLVTSADIPAFVTSILTS